jgi:hypothetical protein
LRNSPCESRKNNHNIYGIRLDCSLEVPPEYRLELEKGLQTMEIMGKLRHLSLIRAHHSIIDLMASFEEIMRHIPK